ncbi:MAG: hypothetical protein OXH07_09020 [Chloroflexi bacterium]|nr:hypothetical protein [Chloroflexota bacterium]
MVTRDMSEDLREREEAMATWRWWEEHHEELLAKYPEQFVVIDKDRQVIGAYPHLTDASAAVEAMDLDFSDDVDVKFLTANKRLHL